MSSASIFQVRARDVRLAIGVEIVTVTWMVVEASLSVGAGVAAGSLLLTAFGVDSVIELISAGMLLWRLSAEAQTRSGVSAAAGSAGMDGHSDSAAATGAERVERAERRAAWVAGDALALLCIYVLVSAVIGLLTRSRPERSVLGIGIAAAAVIVMPGHGLTKRRLAGRLDSATLRGDAAESVTCAYMAATVLFGLLLNAAFGWWWAEYVAALAFLYWLVGETREVLAEAHGARAGARPQSR
jgi:divalent metal cation (Fe/Co/Zn/Cd) transporter